jgi:exopolysaccharide biosynthesis WecB/TagA/CpsF family protein
MSCIQRRFFGVPIVEQSPDDLADAWGGDRKKLTMLIFVDRVLLWRLVRSRVTRQFLLDIDGVAVPAGRGVSRQIRVATGCRVGPFLEFQGTVRVMARAEMDQAGIYIVGRSQDQLQRVEQNVRATFPNLRVVGRAIFHASNTAAITTAIRKAGPRIVFCGTDSPALLRWIRESVHQFGPVSFLVAGRAAQRMAGRSRAARRGAIPALLVRPFIGPALLGHRMLLARRRKKQTA